MKRYTRPLVVLACLLAIGAAAADVHCAAVRHSSNSIVLACSADRLP
jgi:hypothetical protein